MISLDVHREVRPKWCLWPLPIYVRKARGSKYALKPSRALAFSSVFSIMLISRHSLLISVILVSNHPMWSSGQQGSGEDDQISSAGHTFTTPTTPEHEVTNQTRKTKDQEISQGSAGDFAPRESDNEPMVYVTPVDYANEARQERDRLVAEGVDPDSIILMSEVENHVPQREDRQSSVDLAASWVETLRAMTGQGITILNDQSTADVVPGGYVTPDGRYFDLGPGSGATKGEYREFVQWWERASAASEPEDVPLKWLKFEKPPPEDVLR